VFRQACLDERFCALIDGLFQWIVETAKLFQNGVLDSICILFRALHFFRSALQYRLCFPLLLPFKHLLGFFPPCYSSEREVYLVPLWVDPQNLQNKLLALASMVANVPHPSRRNLRNVNQPLSTSVFVKLDIGPIVLDPSHCRYYEVSDFGKTRLRGLGRHDRKL